MHTPREVLNKLRCENCKGHLSCAPIHLTKIGGYLCGRCLPTDEDTTRIKAYEDLANLHNFPCTYKENGCGFSYPFSKIGTHEVTCIWRKYKCPIDDTCDWEDFVGAIVDHCSKNHKEHVVHSPFKHNVANIHSGKYLFKNYQDILVMEVCKNDKLVTCCVKLIGDTSNITNYEYIFVIENGKDTIRRHQKVVPYGNPRLNADKSITIKFDTIKDIVGDIRNIIAQVIIQEDNMMISPTGEHGNGVQMMMPQVTVPCMQCTNVTAPEYRGGWICKDHPSIIQQKLCQNGCGYEDIDVKCKKHEELYCKSITQCRLCEESLHISLAEHYNQKHDGTISLTNVASSLVPDDDKGVAVVNNCIHGHIIYGYRFIDQCFMLQIRSPLPSKELYMYKCVVNISHPDSGRTFTYIAQSIYHLEDDWILCIARHEFDAFSYENKFDLTISIANMAD